MAEFLQDACPRCEAMRPVERLILEGTTLVRGESVRAELEHFRCTVCGTEYDTALSMERNLEAAYAAYRERHSIIAPAEIRALRECYGASQKAFGIILGFGELTINSYEQGALPADANANLLRLVENPEDFRRLYESRKGLIGPTQRKRIEAALQRLSKKHAEHARETMPTYGARPPAESSIYTGFLHPSKDRLFALIQAILWKAGRSLYKTQILKLLFYCDFAHFRKATVSITGWEYAAIDYGPVPNDFQCILPEAVNEGLLVCSPDESQERDLYSLKKDVGEEEIISALSPDELATVEEVVAKIGKKSAKALVDLTHGESAWARTEHAKLISYEWARDLLGV
jgi:putative zinc finger/helix-turn-helix YgiT family protein